MDQILSMARFAEQAGRADEQKDHRERISEPGRHAAPQQAAEIDFGEAVTGADDQPADDRAGDRGKSADDQHRQRLEDDEGERELNALAGSPHQAGDQRDEAGDTPDDLPQGLQPDADRQCRLRVVGDGAERDADAGFVEEDR